MSMNTFINRNILITIGKAGAGIAIGALAMPVVYKFMPTSLKASRRYFGAIHVAVGLLFAGLMKNRALKEVGLYVAATGVYDLIALNIPTLGLTPLPTTAAWLDTMTGTTALPGSPVGASYPVPIAPVSPVARAGIGASYSSRMTAGYHGSYESPDMRTQGLGSDNPYAGIEGFDE